MACVFNSIQVYCHDIKYFTMKVAKTYMSMSPSKTGRFGFYKPEGDMLSWFEKITRLRVFLIQDNNDEIHGEFHYFTTSEYKERVNNDPGIQRHSKFSRLTPTGYTMIGVYVIYMKMGNTHTRLCHLILKYLIFELVKK